MFETALQAQFDSIWTDLGRAIVPHQAPFKLMQLATIGLDGKPKVRHMVLRSVDQDSNTISFQTDLRSPKVDEIGANSAVTVLGYDVENKVQLRLEGVASMHSDGDIKESAWATAHAATLLFLHNPLKPGVQITSPADAWPAISRSEAVKAEQSDKNFAIINIVLQRLERLELAEDAHQRAVFDFSTDAWHASWVSP